MISTSMPISVQSETGVSDKMADANQCVYNEASSESYLRDKKGYKKTARSHREQQSHPLHKVLQKTAFKHRKDTGHHSACRSSQNLFLEGFRDCASEVIRFLTEEENVDDNNPLLIGLQSHLSNVSKTICHETIADLDRQDGELEKKKYGGFISTTILSKTVEDNLTDDERVSSQLSPFLMSPDVTRSANSSVSDSSITESDFSLPLSSKSERNDMSSISECNSSMNISTSLDNSSIDNYLDHSKVDDVFHSPSEHNLNAPTNPVSPLSLLSFNALCNMNNQDSMSNTNDNLRSHNSTALIATSSNESSPTSSFTLSLQPIALTSSLSSFSNLSYFSKDTHIPFHQLPSFSQVKRNHLTFSQVSSRNEIPTEKTFLSTLDTKLSEIPVEFRTENPNFSAERSYHRSFRPEPDNKEHSREKHPECLDHIRSAEDMNINLKSTAETSPETSESFADVLLAVESCRFHEDPRVRGLAEELLHFIHNEEYDDEDDDDLSDVITDDDDENEHNISADVESGVEMLDESVEWSGAADMFDQ